MPGGVGRHLRNLNIRLSIVIYLHPHSHSSVYPNIPHLQAGLELVELKDVDHEQQQHDEVDEEDAAHDLEGVGWFSDA